MENKRQQQIITLILTIFPYTTLVRSIEELTKNSISTITINAKDLKKQSLIIPGMKLIDLTNNTIKFHFDGDINELISKLTKFKIDHLTIEEPTLEEIFMHYYKEDSK